MSNLFRVSHSKVKTWRKCRAAYDYRYRQKLRKKRKSRPLVFGSIVHDMIESFANGLNPFKQLKRLEQSQGQMFRSQAEELGNLIEDVDVIMTEYFEHWEPKGPKHIEYIELNGKRSEHTFEVEIAPGIVAEGKIDAFVKTDNKLRWLGEHKSGKNMLSEDHRWRNLQPAIYIRIVDMVGLPAVDGTLWDYIRSKPPSAPQILKNGELSARGLDTLPLKIERTFKELKIKPSKKHQSLLEQAKRNRSTYFQRVFNPVKKDVVDYLFKGFVTTAKEIADLHETKSASEMNIDFHCNMCDYEPLCRARLQKLDFDFVKKKEYDVGKKFEREEPDFEA